MSAKSTQLMKDPIYVTQPALPPLDEFREYLEKIWETKVLTNGGPFHQQLEQALCEYLGVKYISIFSNGTIALMTALKTLGVTGDVITTPFSFVATAHSLVWNNNRPIFVDIEDTFFNLDPSKIEAAITPHTTAIMPVHVYGNSCQIEEIARIAKKHHLFVIYDACHSFGVKRDGVSVLNAGDLSVLSFHATKVFNTFEGGAIVCHDEATKKRVDFLKNFGFADEVTVLEVGINGKMNEVQAAFGLLQLKYVDQFIARRHEIALYYRDHLKDIPGIHCLPELPNVRYCYTYFPILVTEEYPLTRDELYHRFKKDNLFSRRYFYPLISEFPMYRDLPSSQRSNLPTAFRISNQVLCLPIYPALQDADLALICSILRNPL